MIRRILLLGFVPSLLITGSLSTRSFAQEDTPISELIREIRSSADREAEKTQEEPAPDPKAKDDAKDQDIEKMLEALSRSTDTQKTKGPPPPDLTGLIPDRPEQLVDPSGRSLEKTERTFDQYLRELLGRQSPQENQPPPDQQPSGPLSGTMKKMRDVQQRLEQLDTGKQTRERQEQIVRDFEDLIRQIRQQQQNQQQNQQQTQMAGQQQQKKQQGNQSGENNGQPNGAPPRTPEQNRAMANAKDTWGHLQGAMREVMGNVSRMLPLGEKRELIDRYFLSVAKESIEP